MSMAKNKDFEEQTILSLEKKSSSLFIDENGEKLFFIERLKLTKVESGLEMYVSSENQAACRVTKGAVIIDRNEIPRILYALTEFLASTDASYGKNDLLREGKWKFDHEDSNRSNPNKDRQDGK